MEVSLGVVTGWRYPLEGSLGGGVPRGVTLQSWLQANGPGCVMAPAPHVGLRRVGVGTRITALAANKKTLPQRTNRENAFV